MSIGNHLLMIDSDLFFKRSVIVMEINERKDKYE